MGCPKSARSGSGASRASYVGGEKQPTEPAYIRCTTTRSRSICRSSLRTDPLQIIMTTTPEVSPCKRRGSNSCSACPFSAESGRTSSNSCSACPVVDVPPDEFFFREHDQAASMFVLEAGKVAVLKSWRGREYLLRTLKERDCFGEMAMMDLFPRSASVRAVADCTAIRLSAANLHQVYEQDLKQFALIQMNMGREVTRRLREADNQLFRATMGPGRGHRARFPARGRALAAMFGLTRRT